METLAGPKAGDLYKYMITLSLVVMHKEGSRGIMEETEAMSPSYSEARQWWLVSKAGLPRRQ